MTSPNPSPEASPKDRTVTAPTSTTNSTDVDEDAQHTAIMDAIDRIADEQLAQAAVFAPDLIRDALATTAGRRRILDRHEPMRPLLYKPLEVGRYCKGCLATNAAVRWPCDDYRDAAAGLPNLPEGIAP